MVTPEEATSVAVAIAGLVAAIELLKPQIADLEATVAANGRGIKGLEREASKEKGR